MKAEARSDAAQQKGLKVKSIEDIFNIRLTDPAKKMSDDLKAWIEEIKNVNAAQVSAQADAVIEYLDLLTARGIMSDTATMMVLIAAITTLGSRSAKNAVTASEGMIAAHQKIISSAIALGL